MKKISKSELKKVKKITAKNHINIHLGMSVPIWLIPVMAFMSRKPETLKPNLIILSYVNEIAA